MTVENREIDYELIYEEKCPDYGPKIKKYMADKFNRNLLYDRLPIIKWLPKYKRKYFFRDLLAGITVGLTVIAQGIAYANIAGLDPEYGLYSAFVGSFVYFFFGTCKEITIGPTAIMSLILNKYVQDNNADLAVLATFMTGSIVFILGILNLGFLIQFISTPVTIGFTAGAATTVIFTQIKTLLGLPGSSIDFMDSIDNMILHIDQTKLWDTILGVSAILVLILIQRLGKIKGRFSSKFKYIVLSRNLLVVLAAVGIAYCATTDDFAPFTLTGTMKPGLPPFKPPPFSTTIQDETLTFVDMIYRLSTSLIIFPMIAILEIVAISKTFSKGKSVDNTQELIALGLCNIFGSFVSSMPITGSMGRSAINYASEVQTTLCGLFTGGLVMLALSYFIEIFRYVPKCILASILITASFQLYDIDGTISVWKSRRIEVIPILISLIGCLLFGLEYGIFIGVLLSILTVLYGTARPKMSASIEIVNDQQILHIIPEQSLIFAAAEHVRRKIVKYTNNSSTDNNVSIIVIDGHYVHSIDVTVAKNLKQLVDEFRIQQRRIIFWNWKQQPTGIAWRLHKEFGRLFYQSKSLSDVIEYSQSLQNLDIKV